MDSKTVISPSFIWTVWQDIYKSPFTLSACGHSFCQVCLSKVNQFAILKPNYNPLYFTCPLCSKVTDIPSGDFEKDLPYAEEIELLIREWKEKEFQFDDKYSAADIWKNHLKLLEKFCLDDNQFICWMCHNFNYSDDHRGHRVVTIPEAYKIIKKQSVQNLNLLERMQDIAKHRTRYTSQWRYKIDTDLKIWQKSLNDYWDKIINDINILRKQKLEELFEEFEYRDKYMSLNFDALMSLSDQIKEILDKQPDTLHGVLKQYKSTCGFIQTLSNGIIFPPANDVDITLRLPKYEKIKQIVEYCEWEMDISSTGLPENVIEIINPLKNSKIIPEKEQTDTILNVLPNFEASKLVYRFSDDKFLGQYFRNKVYDRGPTLTIISANKGHVFGGYSPISWTEGVEENWKQCEDSFLFTLTDNKGRQPEILPIDRKK